MKDKKTLISEERHDFESLISVMAALRSEGGCPWDMEQTHESVRKCLIEETYEVIEGIDTDNKELMCEELGDLLFQIMFHSRIEEEQGNFTIDDVVDGISAKMIHRHPHVFGTVQVSDSGEVLNNWDTIKKAEKSLSTPEKEIDRVPPYLPALIRAQKLQGKARRKFSYGTGSTEEALSDAAAVLSTLDPAAPDAEIMADVIFSLAAAAEMSGSDLEAALTKRSDKFVREFAESSENAGN